MALSIVLQFLGLLCLSLAMNKHAKTFFSSGLNKLQSKVLRLIGWSLILISLNYLLMTNQQVGITMVWWLGYLSLGIVSLAIIHSK